MLPLSTPARLWGCRRCRCCDRAIAPLFQLDLMYRFVLQYRRPRTASVISASSPCIVHPPPSRTSLQAYCCCRMLHVVTPLNRCALCHPHRNKLKSFTLKSFLATRRQL